MQHFQSILIVIGITAILAVLVHGFFLSKKNKSTENNTSNDSENNTNEMNTSFQSDLTFEPDDFAHSSETKIDFSNEPEVGAIKFDETEDHKLFEISDTENLDQKETIAKDLEIEPIEPVLETTEQLIDLLEPVLETVEPPMFKELDFNGKEKNIEIEDAPSQEKESVPTETELFIFNVVAKDGKILYGHDLLQFFVSAGLRFGEMSIFHRHVESSGNGEVLFSVANMMAPGIFELNTIEKLETEGVSFFMSAPNNKINVQKAFDLMLVCITNMAEEFDCVVLDANREVLTEDQFGKDKMRLSKFN